MVMELFNAQMATCFGALLEMGCLTVRIAMKGLLMEAHSLGPSNQGRKMVLVY